MEQIFYKGEVDELKKRLITYITLIAMIIFLVTGIILMVQNREESNQSREVEKEIGEEGIFVEKTDEFPYDYTLYEDHVVLEHYYGAETEVVIPKTVEEKPVKAIGRECFYENESISSVALHDNIEVIEKFSFTDCKKLKEIQNGRNVKEIGSCAFSGCEILERVEVGNELEIIGLQAFTRCYSLKKLEPQESLLSISADAFYRSGLEEFSFSDSAEIKDRVFLDTPWLQNQSEEYIVRGDGFFIAYAGSNSCAMLPDGVKTVLGGSFYGTTVEEVYIPQSVTTMSGLVFVKCSGVKVYIPESVTQMGSVDPMECSIADVDAEITIVTTQGSYAQKHAEEYGIPYEIVEPWYEQEEKP